MKFFLLISSSVFLPVLLLLLLTSEVVVALAPAASVGWATYKTLLIERPILTKAATSAVIMTVSDAITQHLIEARFAAATNTAINTKSGTTTNVVSSSVKNKSKLRHNWSRSRQSLLTGFIWSGPSAHFWYELLEVLVKLLQVPSIPVIRLVARIGLDAMLFSPFTIAGFFVVSTLVQRGTIQEIVDKLQTRWSKALFAAWSFWPVVNVVNFGLVPLAYRVLYSNVMALVWNSYLSYVNNIKKLEQQQLKAI